MPFICKICADRWESLPADTIFLPSTSRMGYRLVLFDGRVHNVKFEPEAREPEPESRVVTIPAPIQAPIKEVVEAVATTLTETEAERGLATDAISPLEPTVEQLGSIEQLHQAEQLPSEAVTDDYELSDVTSWERRRKIGHCRTASDECLKFTAADVMSQGLETLNATSQIWHKVSLDCSGNKRAVFVWIVMVSTARNDRPANQKLRKSLRRPRSF